MVSYFTVHKYYIEVHSPDIKKKLYGRFCKILFKFGATPGFSTVRYILTVEDTFAGSAGISLQGKVVFVLLFCWWDGELIRIITWNRIQCHLQLMKLTFLFVVIWNILYVTHCLDTVRKREFRHLHCTKTISHHY